MVWGGFGRWERRSGARYPAAGSVVGCDRGRQNTFVERWKSASEKKIPGLANALHSSSEWAPPGSKLGFGQQRVVPVATVAFAAIEEGTFGRDHGNIRIRGLCGANGRLCRQDSAQRIFARRRWYRSASRAWMQAQPSRKPTRHVLYFCESVCD